MHDLRHVHLAVGLHPHHLLAGILAGALLVGAKHDGARHMANIERRLLRIILGERRLFRIRLHQLLRAGQAVGIGNVLRHRVGEFDAFLVMFLEAGDCRQNRALRLRDIHATGGEGTSVTQIFHVEQQILTDIAGRNEIAVDGIRQTGWSDGSRRGHQRLRDDLSAVDSASGEVQAFAVDIRMVAIV